MAKLTQFDCIHCSQSNVSLSLQSIETVRVNNVVPVYAVVGNASPVDATKRRRKLFKSLIIILTQITFHNQSWIGEVTRLSSEAVHVVPSWVQLWHFGRIAI